MGEFTGIDRWLLTNRRRIVDELIAWRRIPSISTDPAHRDDVHRSAEHLRGLCAAAGFTTTKLLPTAGHPAVYAERGAGVAGAMDPSVPTVLVYGHYDVQPVDPLAAWKSPPFEPTVRGDRLYGRGTIDDGQLFMHVKALEAQLAVNGRLPVNLKLIAEGEEENGSPNFEALVRDNRALLGCDVVVVSDTGMFDRGVPTLSMSLRGLVAFEMTVNTASVDLHSGEFGGAVPNPLNAIAYIQNALRPDPNSPFVNVPGFYDDVPALSAAQREAIAKLPFDAATFRHHAGDVSGLIGEAGHGTLEQLWWRPTLEFNGEAGGYAGDGFKTVIPAQATLKFSCRLTPGQDPATISRLVIAHVNKLAAGLVGVRVNVREVSRGPAVEIPTDHPAFRATADAVRDVYGVEPLVSGEGGSIPPVTVMQRELKAPAVLFGVGLPDDGMHAPNEKIDLPQLYKGMRVVAQMYTRIARAMAVGGPAVPALAAAETDGKGLG